MSAEDNSWRTSTFRQSVVAKIDEAIQRAGVPITKNSNDMEDHVFQKAKTREEYLGFVARLILHVREMSSKKGGGAGGAQGMQQDPINALQTLARTGTGNNQMMGLGPGQGSGMVPQAAQSATNLLQTLNQRPGQQLPNMQGLQNKMPDMGMVPGGTQSMVQQLEKCRINEKSRPKMELASFDSTVKGTGGVLTLQTPQTDPQLEVAVGGTDFSIKDTIGSDLLIPITKGEVATSAAWSSQLEQPGADTPCPEG